MPARDDAEHEHTGETETMRSDADEATHALVQPVDIGSPASPTDASLNEEGNDAGTDTSNVSTTEGERSFGGLSAREAGLRSAEARRRKARARDEDAVAQSTGKVVLVRVPIAIGDIMGRLAADAKRGSTQAARELRSYLEAYPAEDATDMSVLDKRTRQQVIARLLEDIERDEGAAPDGPATEGEATPAASGTPAV